MPSAPNENKDANVEQSEGETGYLLRSPANARRLESALTSARDESADPQTPSSRKGPIMEHRSALTLKAGDLITVPGLGTKTIGAINQVRHDRYQLRLDEKFVESVTADIVITNGEHRSPERHDGPWPTDR
jgi:hypothetical protein